jgi:outer membrane protein OmpA-like peptidoglycan-associated protein
LKTGTIDLSVTGGVRPYRYQWNNNAKTEDLVALGAGNYSVLVRDSVGCTLHTDARVNEPSKLVASLQSYNDINCNGNKTGSISIKISGGTLPYRYKWNNGDTTLNLTNVAAGKYAFSVTDKGGCNQTVAASLSQPSKVDYAIKAVKNVSCFNDKSGGIDLAVSGGIGPYIYNWNNGASTQDLENVAAGKYSVDITDAKGCKQSIAAEVVQPTELILKLDTINHIQCFGNRNGAVFISVSGGVAPYKYLWSNGAITQDINQLPAGQYNVTVSDTKGCIKTLAATVKQPTQLVAKLGDVKNISCFGQKTGSIPVIVSGGVTPYSYKWSNGSSNQNLENVAAGTYSVTITDKNGCSQTLSATISQPTKLVATILSTKGVTCNGGTNGSINISVVGGTQPYQYKWSNGSTSRDLTDTKSGSYKLIIIDASGCGDSTIAAVIKEPSMMNVAINKVTDIAQYGLSTGAVDVNVSGGVQPYRYSWSNGAITQDIQAVPGGFYSLNVYDNNGCEKSVSATINQPPPLVVKLISVQDVKCANDKTGIINIDVTGGVPPYSYKWSNGDSTKNLSSVTAGDYLVTVADATGYKQILNTKIAQPSAIVAQINYSKNLSCYNDNSGVVRVTVSGGNQPYKFNWNSGQSTEDLENVPAGDYTLTVTDNKGCAETVKTTLTQPEQFIAKVLDIKNVACKGDKQGEIRIDATGGVTPYKYLWSNGDKQKDIVGAVAGNYTAIVSDANNCIQNLKATINEPAELIASLATVINNNCAAQNTGSIQVAVSGGSSPYKYIWNSGDSTQNISNLVAGDYNLVVRDSKGCSKALKATITSPTLLEAKLNTVVNIKCFGEKTGAITVDVNGGTTPYAFSWNNGNSKQNLTALPAGDYELTVKDAKGCSSIVNTKVQQPAQLIVAMDTVHNVKCAGESKGFIDISVAGGVTPYSYLWSNGAKTEDLVSADAGNYTIKVQDQNGCVASQSAAVIEPPKFSLVLDSILNVACSGQQTGKIKVRGTGGVQPYNYLWTSGATTNYIRNAAAGDYAVTSTDANGCKSTYKATLTQPTNLIKSIDAITDIRCNGDKSSAMFITVLEGVSPYKFKWSNGADTEDISNLSSGNYTLTITEANGCQSKLDATIEEPTFFEAKVVRKDDIKCFGQATGVLDIDVSGGVQPYQYAWSNGSREQDLSKLKADSYSVLVTDGNGCLRTIHSEITEPAQLALHIDSVRNVKCCGDASGAIFISVSGGIKPYKYQWSHGATTEDIQNLTLGVYTVNVTDANGCVVSTPDEMSLYEQVVSKGMFSTRDILFDVAKATIKPQSFTTINKIATFMKEYPSISFSIEGHTDSDGDAIANQKLSEARAEAIKQALIKFGIRDYRLRARGWGEAKPIATNLTVDGKAQNRRVEFISLTGTLKGDFQEINK